MALQNRYFADNSFSVQPVYEQATVVGVFPPNSYSSATSSHSGKENLKLA